MKKYISPSIELQTISNEDIMNTSSDLDVKFGGLGEISDYAGDRLDFSKFQ